MGEPWTDEDAEEVISYVDLNRDGKIDYEEFLIMISEYDEQDLAAAAADEEAVNFTLPPLKVETEKCTNVWDCSMFAELSVY